jgi:hypothetical protein
MTTLDTLLREVAAVDDVDPASAIAPGTVLEGCYEVRAPLGAGGMATVYHAWDRRLEREVAIKVPRAAPGARERWFEMFEREARATARLSHPHIVELHHVGDHHGTPFAVLELLHGETLAARRDRRGLLTLRESLSILDAVLQALGHAHERGIVHRDLKPHNVFLTTDERIKLLDFGVSIERTSAPGATTRAAGTPGYMPPEHAADPGVRGDLWAAGVLFLECLTGQRTDPSVLDDYRGLPRGVRATIACALAPDPARRPPSATDMRTAFLRVLCPAYRRRRRNQVMLAATAAACAALGAHLISVAPAREPGPPVPRDGRWRGDPAAGTPWETELQRIDDTHFSYRNVNRTTGNELGGTLELQHLADGTTLLAGKWADVPTCPTCGNVGYIEFIVLDGTHLYQNRGMWGPTHADYRGSWPEYRYKWEGALHDLAQR